MADHVEQHSSQVKPAVAAPPKSLIVEAPSPQSLAVTAAARRQRYEELRKRIGTSKLEVKGKPGMHYFWADKSDGGEMVRLDILGYSIVREPKVAEVLAGKAQPEVQANGLRDDGTYQVGDVLLMQCVDEVYEFIQLDVEEKQARLMQSATEDFETSAADKQVPTFRTSKEK